MTKKDYIEIAKVINNHLFNDVRNDKRLLSNMVIASVVSELCTYFEKDNPNFDRERFISACGF